MLRSGGVCAPTFDTVAYPLGLFLTEVLRFAEPQFRPGLTLPSVDMCDTPTHGPIRSRVDCRLGSLPAALRECTWPYPYTPCGQRVTADQARCYDDSFVRDSLPQDDPVFHPVENHIGWANLWTVTLNGP